MLQEDATYLLQMSDQGVVETLAAEKDESWAGSLCRSFGLNSGKHPCA